jgi:hypothetical protein
MVYFGFNKKYLIVTWLIVVLLVLQPLNAQINIVYHSHVPGPSQNNFKNMCGNLKDYF